MIIDLPTSWMVELEPELEKPYFKEIMHQVDEERTMHQVFPPEEDVFTALKLTPFDQVKVVVIGQDPYHDDQQAHGLSFSVLPGVKIPPSLRNIYKELAEDVGCTIPNHGYLKKWADQGVLMLNAVLTVRAHEAGSHSKFGWQNFTDRIIEVLNDRKEPVIFLLWGNYARSKKKLIDETKHHIIESAHPSPLSARRGFFGSKPFSRINEILNDNGYESIDWQIEERWSLDGI